MQSAAVIVGLLCMAARSGLSQTPPQDRPQAVDSAAMACLDRAAHPLIAQAQATLDSAKRRFASGLASGERFFVTVRLVDGSGRWEQVFVGVTELRGDTVAGHIDSHIGFLQGFRRGGRALVLPDAILDWTISKPDGSEDGNLLGKLMDRIQEDMRRTPTASVCDILRG